MPAVSGTWAISSAQGDRLAVFSVRLVSQAYDPAQSKNNLMALQFPGSLPPHATKSNQRIPVSKAKKKTKKRAKH
jgi:hypothetical protein